MQIYRGADTASIVSLVAPLDSYPEVLESLNTVLFQMQPFAKLHVAVNTQGKVSSVTVILSGNDGWITPISAEMKELVSQSSGTSSLASSSEIRTLLASSDATRCSEVSANMDPGWATSVIPLIQLVSLRL